jgi:hypothetical protein
MAGSANVTSLEAVYRFAEAVMRFQTDARMCLTAMDTQLRQVSHWLERDRPTFWKREIETCSHEMAEARIRLHQCRMRRLGDFRPTCYEEQKALEHAIQAHEFAQSQIPNVRHWIIQTQHDSNEFRGRSGQLQQLLDRDIPRLLALLHTAIHKLESYESVVLPGESTASSRLTQFAEALLERLSESSSAPMAEPGVNAADSPASVGTTAEPRVIQPDITKNA